MELVEFRLLIGTIVISYLLFENLIYNIMLYF